MIGWVNLGTTFGLLELRHEALRMKNIRLVLLLAATVTGSTVFMSLPLKAQETQSSATVARKTGTVKSIKGNAITLKPDSGPDVNVTVQEVPGSTDRARTE